MVIWFFKNVRMLVSAFLFDDFEIKMFAYLFLKVKQNAAELFLPILLNAKQD